LTIRQIKDSYDACCLRGSVKEGRALLLASRDPPRGIIDFDGKVRRRFFGKNPTSDPWVRQILRSYHRYWIAVLSERKGNEQAQQCLCQELASLCPDTATNADWEQVEASLFASFAKRQLYFLGGVTLPYRSCYLYASRRKRLYTIALPHDRIVRVPVYFMDDFISFDWQSFATFGRCKTAGWAKTDALFCVKRAYDLKSENFRVGYLQHEAQHFDDYLRFESLSPGSDTKDHLWKSCTLEYRAKLVELIGYSTSTFLERLLVTAHDNPLAPHSYASHKIVKDLCSAVSVSQPTELPLTPPHAIKEAALALLDESTSALQ